MFINFDTTAFKFNLLNWEHYLQQTCHSSMDHGNTNAIIESLVKHQTFKHSTTRNLSFQSHPTTAYNKLGNLFSQSNEALKYMNNLKDNYFFQLEKIE